MKLQSSQSTENDSLSLRTSPGQRLIGSNSALFVALQQTPPLETSDPIEFLWTMWFVRVTFLKGDMYAWHNLDFKEYIAGHSEIIITKKREYYTVLEALEPKHTNIPTAAIAASNTIKLAALKFKRKAYDYFLAVCTQYTIANEKEGQAMQNLSPHNLCPDSSCTERRVHLD